MAERGRPVNSKIRNNILKIIANMKKAYGYEIYKHYLALFGEVHMRSIYYHLKKGTTLGEIELNEIKDETGDYSWGSKAEKLYYTLGKDAQVRYSKRVEDYFKKLKNPKKQ